MLHKVIKILLVVMMALSSVSLMTACSLVPEKSDAISSATQKSGVKTKAPQWQTLDTEAVKKLFEDKTKKAAFIWYNGSELLVVGSLKDTKLPALDQSFSAIDKEHLGYSFVAASPEAFSGVSPDYLIVGISKDAVGSMAQIKTKLKETLAGKAMQKLALDRFYFWVYEN